MQQNQDEGATSEVVIPLENNGVAQISPPGSTSPIGSKQLLTQTVVDVAGDRRDTIRSASNVGLRYGSLMHGIIQFFFIFIYGSTMLNSSSLKGTVPDRINICMAMFLLMPTLMLGFASTGAEFSLHVKRNAMIIFLSAYCLLFIPIVVLNLTTIFYGNVGVLLVLAGNVLFYIIVIFAASVRFHILRREMAEEREKDITEGLVDEV
ncbi:hypothetical protein AKO1_015346 [Acrasis kona]|uniref:Uncharacterized protein n=1 Tax=Acrasis kona TaxID=1008807 RepID=A0AAW2ZFQ4_9EUKA